MAAERARRDLPTEAPGEHLHGPAHLPARRDRVLQGRHPPRGRRLLLHTRSLGAVHRRHRRPALLGTVEHVRNGERSGDVRGPVRDSQGRAHGRLHHRPRPGVDGQPLPQDHVDLLHRCRVPGARVRGGDGGGPGELPRRRVHRCHHPRPLLLRWTGAAGARRLVDELLVDVLLGGGLPAILVLLLRLTGRAATAGHRTPAAWPKPTPSARAASPSPR